MINKFPTIDDVHETLSDLTKLFEDRNRILKLYFKEDRYKDFLLAENLQSLVEADRRDDSRENRIKKDLANGYEVLKAKTNLQRFANFISPGVIPTLELDNHEDFAELMDELDEREANAEAAVDTPEVIQGPKGDKGDPGDSAGLTAPRASGFDHIALPPVSQNSGLALKEGGVVPPSPLGNALNPSAQRPEAKSGVKSLESLGLVGEKNNVVSELTEDLGLEEYKKALADAMALPLKAVAAGLTGLLDSIDIPGGGADSVKKQVSSIAAAFDIPAGGSSSETSETSESTTQTTEKTTEKKGWLSGVKNLFAPKQREKTDDEIFPKESTSDQVGGKISKEERDRFITGVTPRENAGGPSHDGSDGKVAPDQITTEGNYNSIKSMATNVVEGAKSMFSSSSSSNESNSTTSVLNKMLGGVQPASDGSQYQGQDINNLTNQVIENNNNFLSEKTEKQISSPGQLDMSGMGTKFSEMMKMAAQTNMGGGINDVNSVQPTELRVSKYLTATLVTTHGGETPHDQ